MPDTAGLGELWIQFSRLRELCTVTIDVTAVPPGWVVRASPHSDPTKGVVGTGQHLLEALAVAVGRAESLGLCAGMRPFSENGPQDSSPPSHAGP